MFLAGDYEEATDHLEHGICRDLLHRFLKYIGCASTYVHGYVDLLLSPRLIEPEMVVTKRGVLMGEPGSKIVLTLITKAIDVGSRSDPKVGNLLKSWPFQTAGDD